MIQIISNGLLYSSVAASVVYIISVIPEIIGSHNDILQPVRHYTYRYVSNNMSDGECEDGNDFVLIDEHLNEEQAKKQFKYQIMTKYERSLYDAANRKNSIPIISDTISLKNPKTQFFSIADGLQ
jgi:hypothetical protein